MSGDIKKCVACGSDADASFEWRKGVRIPVCDPNKPPPFSPDGSTFVTCAAILRRLQRQIFLNAASPVDPDVPLCLATFEQMMGEMESRYLVYVVGVSDGTKDAGMIRTCGSKARCNYIGQAIVQMTAPRQGTTEETAQ
jgi:hypothetical protein